jgi:predicted esterase
VERVHASADVFERLGADVTKRLSPGMGHTINREEREHVASMVADLLG